MTYSFPTANGIFIKSQPIPFFGQPDRSPFSEPLSKTGLCIFLDFAEKKLDSFAP
jgi:hypothetical protein